LFWLTPPHPLPLPTPTAAMSASTMANWGANFLVSFTFLTLITALGRPATFFLYAGIGVGATLFFALRVPETRHRSLEDIQTQLVATPVRRRATVTETEAADEMGDEP
jgi:hypothetical protein